MQRLLVALVVFGALPFGAPQDAGNVQPQPNPHDLIAQAKVFGNYSKDFKAMEQPSHGEEFELLMFFDTVAKTAEDRLYGANFALEMYDGISCRPDRLKASRILKKELGYYSFLFDSEVTATTGILAVVKVPAVAQLSLKMKDDLRAAKEKLDTIAAALR
jgi:hypothetical protein